MSGLRLAASTFAASPRVALLQAAHHRERHIIRVRREEKAIGCDSGWTSLGQPGFPAVHGDFIVDAALESEGLFKADDLSALGVFVTIGVGDL